MRLLLSTILLVACTGAASAQTCVLIGFGPNGAIWQCTLPTPPVPPGGNGVIITPPPPPPPPPPTGCTDGNGRPRSC